MAERGTSRTLLEHLVRQGDHTIEEWCRRFDEEARQLGETTTLSARQLQRWMAGQVDNARPATRRVAAQVWEHPFSTLLGPAPIAAAHPSMDPVFVGADALDEPTALEVVTIMAAHESTEHAAASGGGVHAATIEQVQAEVWRLANGYASMPPILLLAEARRARDLAYAALDRTHRPAQLSDLYLSAGQLCGLMASASFDLAVWDAAAEQSRAALVYADLIDHAGLRSWARGTQALIEYWTGRPRRALVHIAAGLNMAPAGAALARLKGIEARALSQLGGDPRATLQALAAADDALTLDHPPDDVTEIGGEFGWGPSRHAACAGTALLAIGDAAGAAQRARAALTLVSDDPSGGLVGERAHIDLAAAELAQGELDAAESALEPVWVLPIAQRRHGITDRLAGISRVLTSPTWSTTPTAGQLRDHIEVFNGEAGGRALPQS